MPLALTLLPCSMSGVTCLALMDTAPPSYSLVDNSELVCLPCLLKFAQLTSQQRLFPRTPLTIVPSSITTDRKHSFPCYLLAKQFCCKIRRLLPGHAKALSALFDRIIFLTLCQWPTGFSLDLVTCSVQLPLRSALHLLRPPLELQLHSHVDPSVNRMLLLFPITHLPIS